MALSRTPQPNGTRLGKYELLRELVTSNVGTSWLAAPDDEPVEVTIHKVHRHMAKAPTVVDAFIQGATTAKGLRHENVLGVLDCGVQDGEPWVAVQYGGESLATVLRMAGNDGLPVPVALRIALDVIDGFSAAHGYEGVKGGLGHGEIGPWCVYVGSDGITRTSGFQFDQALWRFGAHYVKNLERLSYAAPERVRAMSSTLGQNLSVADEESDLFSVAVLVFELVAKQRLFASKMEAAVVQKVLTSTIPQASSVRADLPAEVNDALKKALSRDRDARFKTFDEFATALESAGEGVIASADTVSELVQAARASGVKPSPQARGTLGFSDRMSAVAKPTSAPAVATPTPPAVAPALEAKAPGPVAGSVGVSRTPATTQPMLGAPKPPLPRSASTPAMPAVRNGAPTLPGAGEAVPGSQKPKFGRLPAKTLLGFGKDLTPSQPPPAIEAPPSDPPPNLRASSVELTDADLVTEEMKAPELAPAPVPPGPAMGRKRTATLLGIQAPEVADLLPPVREVAKTEPMVPPEAPKPAPARAPAPAPVPKAKLKTKTGHRGHGIDQMHPGAVLEALGGAYELIAPVARGGMAVVWAAREVGSSGDHGMGPNLGNIIAIKTMLPELVDEEDFESMFVDESRVAAKIRHRNVAGILGLGQAEDLLFIAMEWVDGETLSTIQQAARPLGGVPAPVLVNIAAQTAAGLYAAHQLKDDAGHSLDLIHRDISPANVLLTRSGQAKIVDFGIAKSKGRLHVTRASGLVKGKTPYLSPEQIGGLPIDHRSDLFSLGVLLYVLATGKHPFRGDTEIQTLENIAIHAPKPLRQVDEEVTPGFERIVLKLLEKDPKRRYQDAHQVELDLRALDATFEKPSTEAEVAAFVVEAVGDKLDARRHMLEQAVETFSPARTPTPAVHDFSEESTVDERRSGVSAKELVEEIALDRLGDAPAAEPSPAAPAAEPTASPAKEPRPDEPVLVPAPAALPVFDFQNDESVDGPSPIDAAVPPAAAPRPSVEAVEARAARSKGQLVKLILLGVGLGLAIVAGIEISKRVSGGGTPAPTATVSAAPSATSPAKPTPVPTTPASSPPAPTAPTVDSAPAPSAAPSASGAPSAKPAVRGPPIFTPPNGNPGNPPIARPTGI